MQLPITPIRRRLFSLAMQQQPITGIRGITLVEKRNREADVHEAIDCTVWVYGSDATTIPYREIDGLFFAKIRDKTYEVNAPRERDLAIYIAHLSPKESRGLRIAPQVHIGRVFKDNLQIVSKWGYGHVYIHKPELVPTCYGEEVRFFREPTSQTNL